MSSTRWAALLALVVSCGGGEGSTAPATPAKKKEATIAKLIVATADTGFWKGQSLDLSKLVKGAVTTDGDTVAPPAVTWAVPSGFAQSGNAISATRESRGELVASFGTITASPVKLAAMQDLAQGMKWNAEYRCYGGTWDATRTTDTVAYQFHSGAASYSEAPWARGSFQAMFTFDSLTQTAYLSDGSVSKTVLRGSSYRYLFHQDTASLRLIASSDTVPMRRTADPAVTYQADAPICTVKSGWQKDGTPLRLHEG